MNGFINILKPPGMSSAAVVGIVKRLTGEKRVGHAGTLDPEAAGVLPIMVGKATRLFDYVVDKEKEYVSEVAFGESTDTQDATGIVTDTGSNFPSFDDVAEAASKLTGDIIQRPSMYSAIKKNGTPLYQLARKGEHVEVPVRQVHVESISIHTEMPNHGFLMTVKCGKGTYIRSICSDLGELCSCPSHMRFLLRTQSGVFRIENAITIEELKKATDEGTISDLIIPPDIPLRHYASIELPAYVKKLADNGSKIQLNWLKEAQIPEENVTLRVYCEEEFCGMASCQGKELTWLMHM